METRFTLITKVLRRSPVFRFLTLGILVLVGFWVARLYLVDMPRQDRAKIASSGKDMLPILAEKLPKDVKTLPMLTPWYPSNLPCGIESVFPEDPFWQRLGLMANAKSHYQYRFHFEGGRYTLMARRDSDCDGLFVVHTMNGKIGNVGDVTSKNVGE